MVAERRKFRQFESSQKAIDMHLLHSSSAYLDAVYCGMHTQRRR